MAQEDDSIAWPPDLMQERCMSLLAVLLEIGAKRHISRRVIPVLVIDNFGYSVSLDSDGDTLAVGANWRRQQLHWGG